jgi:hypothetical protein
VLQLPGWLQGSPPCQVATRSLHGGLLLFRLLSPVSDPGIEESMDWVWADLGRLQAEQRLPSPWPIQLVALTHQSSSLSAPELFCSSDDSYSCLSRETM